MAYIDSELAKRHSESVAAAGSVANAPNSTEVGEATLQILGRAIKEVQRQPAALGKLLEIDLGNEVRDRNVERTEQARRMMDGQYVEEENTSKAKKKVKLGKDGKPWRGRKRRTSEDIMRDKFVEEVLRENKCRSLFPYPRGFSG